MGAGAGCLLRAPGQTFLSSLGRACCTALPAWLAMCRLQRDGTGPRRTRTSSSASWRRRLPKRVGYRTWLFSRTSRASSPGSFAGLCCATCCANLRRLSGLGRTRSFAQGCTLERSAAPQVDGCRHSPAELLGAFRFAMAQCVPLNELGVHVKHGFPYLYSIIWGGMDITRFVCSFRRNGD